MCSFISTQKHIRDVSKMILFITTCMEGIFNVKSKTKPIQNFQAKIKIKNDFIIDHYQ